MSFQYVHAPRRRLWFVRLGMTVMRWRGLKFSWGERDCAQFAVQCARAQTGVDYGKLLPEYTSAVSANSALRRMGGHSEAVSQLMIPTDEPETGDVVMVEWREMAQRGWSFIFGVIVGDCVYVPREQGLMTLTRGEVIMSWSPEFVNPELL